MVALKIMIVLENLNSVKMGNNATVYLFYETYAYSLCLRLSQKMWKKSIPILNSLPTLPQTPLPKQFGQHDFSLQISGFLEHLKQADNNFIVES